MSYDPKRSTVPDDGDEPLWTEGEIYDSAAEDYDYYADDDDPESVYYDYLLGDDQPAVYFVTAEESIQDLLDAQFQEVNGIYDATDEEAEPVWTQRRVLLLFVALVIIASLVLYLIIPLLELIANPPPTPPMGPPDLL